MNQESGPLSAGDHSSTYVEILIEESWINRFLTEQKVNIPLNKKNRLTNLNIHINPGAFSLVGDIESKEGSTIQITVGPIWDPEKQYLRIKEVKLQMRSKSLILKSKGWLAQHFLSTKLDKKIEEAANLLLAKKLRELTLNPVQFPFPESGNAEVDVSNAIIYVMEIVEHGIIVKTSIEGKWKVKLSVRES